MAYISEYCNCWKASFQRAGFGTVYETLDQATQCFFFIGYYSLCTKKMCPQRRGANRPIFESAILDYDSVQVKKKGGCSSIRPFLD